MCKFFTTGEKGIRGKNGLSSYDLFYNWGMDQEAIQDCLSDLSISAVRYFHQVGSTNDIALDWASQGGPDLGLVIADEQSAGRGRGGRRWHTPPGAALALSLIILPKNWETNLLLARATALGALAVCDALDSGLGIGTQLKAEVKWPNDVLVNGQKIAGVLAEAQWEGNQLKALVLGIGINIAPYSVPPADLLNYPATCLEAVAGKKVGRLVILHAVLEALIIRRPTLSSPEFIRAWESRLAFRQTSVRLVIESGVIHEGTLLGLSPEGFLRLHSTAGEEMVVRSGEIHLRPVDRSPD